MKELVGQGKPFYSAIDKAAGLLKRKVGTGAEFMKELMSLPGIKQTEIQERGLGDVMGAPKMTHEQFMSMLGSKPAPPIHEKVLGKISDPEFFQKANEIAEDYYGVPYGKLLHEEQMKVESLINENTAHHQGWTLPGGENYREMLIKAPKGADQFEGVDSHFGGEPGILASMRLKDRKGPNGEKLLHLEELQSDWHQQGRDKGYKQNALQQYQDEINRLALESNIGTRNKSIAEIESELIPNLTDSENKKLDELDRMRSADITAVPNAPFKKNWEEMELKRLIHHAAEKGYHGVVVTPGAEQADRYGLAKHVGMVSYHPGEKRFQAFKPNRETVVNEKDASPDRVAELIGKEAAQRLLAAPKVGDHHFLEGEDLNIGGEGMKGFYDKKVPNILNSIGKKYGVKTQLHGHPIKNGKEKMIPDNAGLGMIRSGEDEHAHLHHFPITENMRKDILTNGLPLYAQGGIIHKATGGSMPSSQPNLAQMRLSLAKHANPALMDSIGVNEALDMSPKMFVNPTPNNSGIPGVGGVRTASGLPIGGADMNPQQPGQQLMPPPPPRQGQQVQQGQQPGGTQALGAPTGATGGAPAQMGNLLSMTPQGQAMQAMQPQNKAGGGKVDRRPFENSSERIKRQVREGHYPEEQTAMDKYKELAMMRLKLEQAKKNPQKMADGGQPVDKGHEETDNEKRILIRGEGRNGVKGIVVPRHMWEGKVFQGTGPKAGQKVEGMRDINEARAKVYGAENRDPLTIGQVGNVHKRALAEHFAKPLHEQIADEKAALERLREAKHIGKKANTLDESEKLDTVRHELGANKRPFIGFASKGVAGHALYTSGYGEHQKHHIINTCPGQTVGCGGGTDEHGIVDTMKGTCFAPNAESQYVNASIRRAAHEQAKHDPAMTKDWILAHTGSLRDAANDADEQKVNLLFRPNVVDETDVSSRHVIKGLNKQRKAQNKSMIIANSYGKTNELHDPANGYYVTHSNIGPKVKMGQEIADHIGKDRQRIGNTINAATASGNHFVNEEGDKTPPKNSYMVTDVKRGSPLSRDMEKNITHAKYWSTGREGREISPEEQAEGEEGHYDAHGKPTTPDKSHYGHMTFEGKRFDYQKQHILHPRLVQVGVNEDGTPHMIPTDSRFKDNEYLPKKRFMTKNGKVAGAILMTTPTESTSTLGHQTSFTHHVNPTHIDYAKRNKGEYEIDSPMQQILAQGREYVAPQPIKFLKKGKKTFAMGGHVVNDGADELNDDNCLAFPERNFATQHHLAKREGFEDLPEDYDLYSNEVK